MFSISIQNKSDLWHCTSCDTYFKESNTIHSCDSIRLRKLIRKRVARETIKYSLIGFFFSLMLFLVIMLCMAWNVIVSYSNTIHYIKEEIGLIHKVTDIIIDTKVNEGK